MLRPKKELKLTNAAKEILEELTLWQKLEAFWVVNSRVVTYVGVGGLVVVVALLMWNSHRRATAAEAALALSRITNYYDAGQYQKAIDGDSAKTVRGQEVRGLRVIADEYGSTGPGKVAQLYLGNSYYYLGQYDKAQEAYSSAEGIDNPALAAAALAGQAAIAESKKNFVDAAKLFERAAAVMEENPNNPIYIVSAARCFAQSLQTSKAVELYRRVVFEFAGTSAEETAKHALAELHVEL